MSYIFNQSDLYQIWAKLTGSPLISAYVFNQTDLKQIFDAISAGGGVTGSGTPTRIAMWNDTTELTDGTWQFDGINLVPLAHNANIGRPTAAVVRLGGIYIKNFIDLDATAVFKITMAANTIDIITFDLNGAYQHEVNTDTGVEYLQQYLVKGTNSAKVGSINITRNSGADVKEIGLKIFNNAGNGVFLSLQASSNDVYMRTLGGTVFFSLQHSSGNVGFGTLNPTAKVHISGANTFRYADTNQASGKVLTSDANGVASWQTPSSSANPTGTILMWAGTNAGIPSGYLKCNGQVVSQTTYAALYAVIGGSYNTGGEGAGNFRLPNYTGRVASGGTTDTDGGRGSLNASAVSGTTASSADWFNVSSGFDATVTRDTHTHNYNHTLLLANIPRVATYFIIKT